MLEIVAVSSVTVHIQSVFWGCLSILGVYIRALTKDRH